MPWSVALLAACLACFATGSPLPARPWVQHGDAFVFEMVLAVADVRSLVPKEFDIVETKPGSGLTKGAAYVARYGAGSAVQRRCS